MSPSSACLETQQSLRARRRQGEKVTGHLVRIDSSSPPQRDKEDILQTKQNTRCSSHFFHIHPGAFSKRHREELLPVFPPKWKELSTIITTFFYQKLSPLHWQGQQWPRSVLWWLIHSSSAFGCSYAGGHALKCQLRRPLGHSEAPVGFDTSSQSIYSLSFSSLDLL